MIVRLDGNDSVNADRRYTPPQFGSKVQFAKVDLSAKLPKDKITHAQKVVGKLLCHARAVDPTMMHAVNDISLSAAKGTEETMEATMYSLNCAATNPETEIICRASDATLRCDSDAAYLVAPEARSRAGGYQYLSNKEGTLFNGPVLVSAKVIKNVMASAAEAELEPALVLYLLGTAGHSVTVLTCHLDLGLGLSAESISKFVPNAWRLVLVGGACKKNGDTGKKVRPPKWYLGVSH